METNKIVKKENLKFPGDSNYFVEEAFKFLRTNIQFCGAEIKTISVTSCYENEGKTTVALGIAKSFADMGKKVLFIDADMRKSVIAGRNLEIEDYKGLSEIITKQNTKEDMLRPTTIDNLFIILAGTYPPNPAELLNGTEFENLMKTVREEYDYVLVDCPPLTAVSDAAVIAHKCDGSILVIGEEKIGRKDALEVLDSLKKSGTRVLGCVRNDSTVTTKSYGRHSYYSRYAKYGYYKKNENEKKENTEENK